MVAKRATIDDVARDAGVSKATVSAVLNNRSSVSGTTRERVLSVMEQLNYRPSERARRTRTRRNGSIGILIREIDNPFYSEVIAGARAFASQHDYTVLVASSEGDYEEERRALELLQEMDVDGLILYPVLNQETDLSPLFELKRRNFPFILLESIWGLNASLFGVDNAAASGRAVEHLMSMGHTRIVHFAGPSYSMHGKERIDGLFRAFSRSHIAFNPDAIVPTGAHLEDGYRVGLQYFAERSEEERPTAVTCFNDMVALGLCRALAELGLSVPDDVSVIGYDNLPVLDYLSVPLTSVHVPKFEIGEQAAKVLIRHIEARKELPPQNVQFPAELVIRGSTRPLDAPVAKSPFSVERADPASVTREPRLRRAVGAGR
jgi:LacI family transcriptional regulator/LacI family repressor for deo operon, udp, cdd, tsx, nupC, and nupG